MRSIPASSAKSTPIGPSLDMGCVSEISFTPNALPSFDEICLQLILEP
jgi:hypothetical protein